MNPASVSVGAAPHPHSILEDIGKKLGTQLTLKDLIDEVPAGQTGGEEKTAILDDGTVRLPPNFPKIRNPVLI